MQLMSPSTSLTGVIQPWLWPEWKEGKQRKGWKREQRERGRKTWWVIVHGHTSHVHATPEQLFKSNIFNLCLSIFVSFPSTTYLHLLEQPLKCLSKSSYIVVLVIFSHKGSVLLHEVKMRAQAPNTATKWQSYTNHLISMKWVMLRLWYVSVLLWQIAACGRFVIVMNVEVQVGGKWNSLHWKQCGTHTCRLAKNWMLIIVYYCK